MRSSKEAGVTLVELLVVAATSSILSLAVASLLIFSIEQFKILVQQHRIEEQMLWASYHIRGFLSQAVNLQTDGTGCNLTNINQAHRGLMINSYIQKGRSGPPGSTSCDENTDTIAVFPRENAFNSNNVDLFTSAIFYEPPRATGADGQPNPGKLYFDVGSRSGGSASFFPDDTDIVYTGLSNFAITDIDTMDAQSMCDTANCNNTLTMIKSAKITLTFRYFLVPNGRGGRYYDYYDLDDSTAAIDDCIGQTLSCRDRTNDIHINFHNNIMVKCEHMMTGCDRDAQPTYKERIFGNIYFYKMVIPPEIIL